MNGLGALIGVYMVGVLFYFAVLQVYRYQQYSVQNQLNALKTDYTNAVKLNEQVQVLQNQLNLKYAALDCFKTASDWLPTGFILSRFHFQSGQRLMLEGSAPLGDSIKLSEYSDNIGKEAVNSQRLFSKVEKPDFNTRGSTIIWKFRGELNRIEGP